MTRVIGIDEAGRGPVLGPLVIGMVEWSPDCETRFQTEDLPLEDSKKLTPEERSETFAFLRETVRYRIFSVPAWVIAQPGETIPQLEARVIKEGLGDFDTNRVYCDALGSGDRAHQWIKNEHDHRTFRFESGADDTYPCVSAASILAKVVRDRAIEALKTEWGELGSGYPSDPTTRDWIRKHHQQQSTWPPFVRTNWGTVRDLTASDDASRSDRPG